MLDLKLTAISKGGHASSPPKNTAVGLIANAVCKIEYKPFKQHLTFPVKSLFKNLGANSKNNIIKFIFKNQWLTSKLIKLICKIKGGEMVAMTKTTVAVTMANGSKQPNILPESASVFANIRIIQGDTVQSVINRISKIVGNQITIEKVVARITSYNVCYTKLLRFMIFFTSLRISSGFLLRSLPLT